MNGPSKRGFSLRQDRFPHKRQEGVALAVVLLLLLTIILIGVSALRTDVIENRISGIDHNRALAFQAAGAALHDAEHLLDTTPPPASAYSVSCVAGLCLPSTTATPAWASDTFGAGDSITYGDLTSATALSGVPPPRYIIERLPKVVINGGRLTSNNQYAGTPSGVQIYRITARGWGAHNQSWVEVQSVFNPY